MKKQKSHQIKCDLESLLLEIQLSLSRKRKKYVNCKTFGIHVANKGCTGKLVTKVNDKKNCLCSVHCAWIAQFFFIALSPLTLQLRLPWISFVHNFKSFVKRVRQREGEREKPKLQYDDRISYMCIFI